MKTHSSVLLLSVLVCALLLASCPAHAVGDSGKICANDEYPVFYGEANGTVAAICLPDDPSTMGH